MVTENSSYKVAGYDFVNEYNSLLDFFSQYKTPESEKKLAVLSDEVERNKSKIAVFVFGSLKAGMAREDSDTDISCITDSLPAMNVLGFSLGLHYVTDYRKASLENTIEMAGKAVTTKLYGMFMARQRNAFWGMVAKKEGWALAELTRFYSTVLCSEILNKQFVDGILGKIRQDHRLNETLEYGTRKNLAAFFVAKAHERSFSKYMSRLTERKIKVPRDIEGRIDRFISECVHSSMALGFYG